MDDDFDITGNIGLSMECEDHDLLPWQLVGLEDENICLPRDGCILDGNSPLLDEDSVSQDFATKVAATTFAQADAMVQEIHWEIGVKDVKLKRYNETPGFTKNNLENSPLDSFLMFFTTDILENLLSNANSNLHAKAVISSPDSVHQQFILDDIKAYLGICLVMAVSPRTKIRDHWSTDAALTNPYISSVMPLKKFLNITDNISIFPNSAEYKTSTTIDLNKVEPFLNLLRKSITCLYKLHRECTILDMTKTLGSLQNQNKLFRLLILKDATTGYIKDFWVGSQQSCIETLISSLKLNQCVYLQKGIGSVQLCSDLLSKHKIYSCSELGSKATVGQTTVENVLASLQVKRGDISSLQVGNTVIFIWQGIDRMTPMVSTMNSTAQVKNKLCPTIVRNNDEIIRVHSEFRKYFSSKQQSLVWWKQFLWLAVDISMDNAYLSWKQTNDCHGTRRSFILDVAKSLVGNYALRNYRIRVDPAGFKPASGHKCVKLTGRARMCRQCKHDGELTNSGHRKETTYGCSTCNVNLCKDGCFFKFHSVDLNSKPNLMGVTVLVNGKVQPKTGKKVHPITTASSEQQRSNVIDREVEEKELISDVSHLVSKHLEVETPVIAILPNSDSESELSMDELIVENEKQVAAGVKRKSNESTNQMEINKKTTRISNACVKKKAFSFNDLGKEKTFSLNNLRRKKAFTSDLNNIGKEKTSNLKSLGKKVSNLNNLKKEKVHNFSYYRKWPTGQNRNLPVAARCAPFLPLPPNNFPTPVSFSAVPMKNILRKQKQPSQSKQKKKT